ncbi:hypothetical protein Tco_0705735, partial [Tanacetum coccineum]
MDRLSKRKFGIVCHGKVVRIPLEGDEILRVHGERTQGVVKTLMNTKVDLVPGATPVAKSPYRLAPLEMQELSEQLQELQDEEEHGVHLKLELELLRKEKLYAKVTYLRFIANFSKIVFPNLEESESSIKDKILATPSETSKVENAPAEMLRDLNQQMEKRADDGIGESSLTGLELVHETTNKVVLVKENPKAVRDRQKSYVDYRRKSLEFEVGDRVLLRVSPWKGVVYFGKNDKLAPRYVGPLEILKRVGPVAYRLRLPEELSGIKVEKTLCFVEEPVEIMDREIRNLKHSKISLVK